MKRNFKTISLAMSLLVITGVFTSCNNKKKTTVIPVAVNNEVIVEETIKTVESRNPIVFITGIDKGENKFYKNAREYFINQNHQVVDNAFSMQEIFTWLNKNYNGSPYGEIHIVSHSNPWRGLSLETVIKGDRVTTESLQKVLAEDKLPLLKNGILSSTKVIFHSCGLGKNQSLMKVLKTAFVADEAAQVIASPYYNIFGGEFSEHYLAKPYYVFYPTANSPGKVDLSKEIARKYPEETEIDWYDALNNVEERYVGDAYTYQFNIPVEWEFDYTNSDNEIPSFKLPEEIMDWIAEDELLAKEFSKFEIPLEKFRWKSVRKGNKLIIKGKTTVLCVLKPLIKPYGDLQHIEPDTENLRLYAMN